MNLIQLPCCLSKGANFASLPLNQMPQFSCVEMIKLGIESLRNKLMCDVKFLETDDDFFVIST